MTARRALAALLVFAAAGAAQQHDGVGTDKATDWATDWAAEIDRAATARRYGLRLAAARRVGQGGAAAVPAMRAWQEANGAAAVPVALVEAFADHGGVDPSVLQLLEDWAQDREFFWRAQALRGLASRADDPELAGRWADLFDRLVADPAWLVRTFAHFGKGRRLATQPDLPHDPDPRARTRLAALTGNLRALLPALGDERVFLGVPWGRQRASEAIQALKGALGTDSGFRAEATFADNGPAIDELRRLVAEATRAPAPAPERLVDPEAAFVGGVELLSCRNGDLFVRWTADGRVSGDVTPVHRGFVQIDPETWHALSNSAAALDLPPQSGVVICDRMRLQMHAEAAQAAVAPAAASPALADWLKRFAAAIEEAGEPHLAGHLRDRLPQFLPPSEDR
ncbi:MAG: hypothetical protein AB7O97_02510 [Planctomycetota bacterium]